MTANSELGLTAEIEGTELAFQIDFFRGDHAFGQRIPPQPDDMDGAPQRLGRLG